MSADRKDIAMKIELDYVKVGDYYLPDLTVEPPRKGEALRIVY